MASRFRIFRRPIASSPENVTNFTKAAVALHNFLILDKGYCPQGYADYRIDNEIRQGDWRKEIEGNQGLIDIPRTGSNNYSGDAKEVRDNLCKYFNSDQGAVPWQWNHIQRTLDNFDRE